MTRRRKHIIQSLSQEIQPPKEDQHIVKALGSRGDNLIEVEYPAGGTGLVLLPARFNKKLWIRRGGYLIVQHQLGKDIGSRSRISGTIESVLYPEDIAFLQEKGCWPMEFKSSRNEAQSTAVTLEHSLEGQQEAGSDSDDDLPPLQPNINRPVITYDQDGEGSDEEQLGR